MADTSFPRLCVAADQLDLAVATTPKICQPLKEAFEEATGWVLDFEESRSSYRRREAERLPDVEAQGRLLISDMSVNWSDNKPAANREHCDRLAASVSQLYSQTQQYRDELRLAHTQLAVPGRLALPRQDAEKLQQLFTKLLETAVSQFGFHSGAVMVLDEATTMLVQRVGIGEQFASKNGMGRLLGECRADVEALSGSVVVLSKRSEVALWQAPSNCRSAVCIPISSMHNLLGTLWLAGDESRELTSQDTNMLEIIAGRIAAELESAALRANAIASQTQRPIAVAEACLDDSIHGLCVEELAQPPFEGWRIEQPKPSSAARTAQALACCQVDSNERMQIIVGCGLHQSEAQELTLIRQSFPLLRGLDLDARQMFEALKDFLNAEAAFRPSLRLGCLLIDPLSGEFDFCGNPTIHTRLDRTSRIDRCEPGRHVGFLLHESRLSLECIDCQHSLLHIFRT